MSADYTLQINFSDLNVKIHSASDQKILDAIHDLKETVMTSKDDVVTQLAALKAEQDATNAQNAKAFAEISTGITANTATVTALTQQVADLQAQLASAGADVPPDIVSAVAALQASADAAKVSAQALDDLTPDAPVAG